MDRLHFVKHLEQFIDAEYEAARNDLLPLWKLPVQQRVAQGLCATGMRRVSVKPSTLTVEVTTNLSRFRVGDSLRLNAGDPSAAHVSVTLEVEEDHGDTQTWTLRAFRHGALEHFTRLYPVERWCLDQDLIDLREFNKKALNVFLNLPPFEDTITDVLFGETLPGEPDLSGLQRVMDQFGFNASQARAFITSTNGQPYTVVQGPPGTGKTRVLAEIALHHARQGKKVMVTGFTHRSINNALNRIQSLNTGSIPVVKVGQVYNGDDLLGVQNVEYLKEAGLLTGGFIVGSTCFSVGGKRLLDANGRAFHFDVQIFDEASQMSLPVAIMGMLGAKRYVYIGDHQQMPPVVVGKHKEKWVTRSVFEHVFNHHSGTMLDTTYRMCDDITRFPSLQFYGGKLTPHPKAASGRLRLTRTPAKHLELLDPAKPSVWAEVQHHGETTRCEMEATLISSIIEEAVQCGVPAHEIAVVTPFRLQVRLIRRKLRQKLGPLAGDVLCDTVERIQGQERDMVLLSLVSSSYLQDQDQAAFFFQPNRLNVAITRAKSKRIIVGNPQILTGPPSGPVPEGLVVFQRLHQDSVKHRPDRSSVQ